MGKNLHCINSANFRSTTELTLMLSLKVACLTSLGSAVYLSNMVTTKSLELKFKMGTITKKNKNT